SIRGLLAEWQENGPQVRVVSEATATANRRRRLLRKYEYGNEAGNGLEGLAVVWGSSHYKTIIGHGPWASQPAEVNSGSKPSISVLSVPLPTIFPLCRRAQEFGEGAREFGTINEWLPPRRSIA